MKYRVMKDSFEPPIFWVEKLIDGEWLRVFGTTEFAAEDSLARVEVTPEERAMLLSFTPENHGGCFPRDGDGSYWLTGSDLA